jgi:hypothetical protein
MIWYSLTHGRGGGRTSVTCRGVTPVIAAPDRSAPQLAQHSRSQRKVSSGSSTNPIVAPGPPGCLPGLRPETPRSERLVGLR